MSRPDVMREAEIDLGGTVRGRFSPSDWSEILRRAEISYRKECDCLRERGPGHELAAWQNVVRDFHQNSYWGFVADYQPPKPEKKKSNNLGLPFIWMVFNAMVVSKVAILWFGQLYSRSEDALYKWIFFALMIAFLGNFAFFLWRHRHYPED